MLSHAAYAAPSSPLQKEEPFIPISEERGFLARFGKYRTVKPSYYLSEKEVAELEDGFDIFDEQAGWHTEAHLVEEGSQC